MYRQALKINPFSVAPWTHLGIANGKLERYPDAIASFQRAVELDPDNAAIHYNIGYAHLLSGNEAAAKMIVEELYTLDPEVADRLRAEIDVND